MDVVGIGIRPNIGLAEAAGAAIDNGISSDAMGRTSLPHIWAAGDFGRRLIEAGKSPDADAIADPQPDLKSLM